MYKPLAVFFGLASFANFRAYTDVPNTHVLSTLYYGGAPLKKFIFLSKPAIMAPLDPETAGSLCKLTYI